MIPIVYIVVGALLLLALVLGFVFLKTSTTKPLPKDPLERVHHLLGTIIQQEDDFIQLYMRIIRDEGFAFAFSQREQEARKLLTTLVEDSTWHKKVLEEAQSKIK